jgi:hypothetical protein
MRRQGERAMLRCGKRIYREAVIQNSPGLSCYATSWQSSARRFAEAVAAHFAVNDLIRLRPFAKVLPSQAITANSLARLQANSVKNSNISRLKTCGLSKFAR